MLTSLKLKEEDREVLRISSVAVAVVGYQQCLLAPHALSYAGRSSRGQLCSSA